jgi:PKD repeat protein
MRTNEGVIICLILLIFWSVAVYSAEDSGKNDLSVQELIKEDSLQSSEAVTTIDISKIPVVPEENATKAIPTPSEEEGLIIPLEEVAEESPINEEPQSSEEIEVLTPTETEQSAKFDFVSWVKKILGIKPVEEENLSYIAPEEIMSEEETSSPSEITTISAPVAAKPTGNTTGQGKVVIVKETDLVNLVPKAYDPDKDLLKYTFTSPLNQDGKWQTNYGDAGQYTVTVTASDGQLSSSQDVLIIVNKKEEAPTIDSFTPESLDLEANENSVIEFKAIASDLNKDKLTYSWKLDGKQVSSTESYTYKISYDDAGTHTMKLTVSDGNLDTTKLWTIKVNNVNRLPILEKIPDIRVKETETVKITPKATDPDGDPVKFTISEPVGDTGVWKTTYDDAGEYTVKVTASDGTDSTSQNVKVTVDNVNRAPVIEDILQS